MDDICVKRRVTHGQTRDAGHGDRRCAPVAPRRAPGECQACERAQDVGYPGVRRERARADDSDTTGGELIAKRLETAEEGVGNVTSGEKWPLRGWSLRAAKRCMIPYQRSIQHGSLQYFRARRRS